MGPSPFSTWVWATICDPTVSNIHLNATHFDLASNILLRGSMLKVEDGASRRLCLLPWLLQSRCSGWVLGLVCSCCVVGKESEEAVLVCSIVVCAEETDELYVG